MQLVFKMEVFISNIIRVFYLLIIFFKNILSYVHECLPASRVVYFVKEVRTEHWIPWNWSDGCEPPRGASQRTQVSGRAASTLTYLYRPNHYILRREKPGAEK